MGRLSVALLGAPDVRHAGQALRFPARKVQALLVYLMTEGGTHPRARLTDLLWPESSPANGRAGLRVALARLRDTLGDDAGHESHLVVEGDALGFNFTSAFDFDVHTFLDAFTRAGAPLTGPDEARSGLIAQLRAAADAYRGDFLAGFSLSDAPDFDDWAATQREAFHRRMDVIFERLTQLYADGGDVREAIDVATRWVVHHTLSEVAHRRLMQARFMAGDRVGALAAYDACRAVLAREFGASPLPETTALAERIRLAAPPRRVPARALETLCPAALALDVPLVGRAGEFGQLIEAFQAACHQRAQAVVLEGEAGAGKTRLATEFLRWAAAQGADVLQGRAFETGGHLPYGPLVDALRARVALLNAPDDLLGDVWLAELSRLLPELQDRYPDLPAPTADESTAPTRLFEAIACLGLALARRAPVVLFVDDVQWADAASLDALHYLAWRWMEGEARAMVLLTLRSEARATGPSLSAWLAGLGRLLPLAALPLGSLSPADTAGLVHALAAHGGSALRAGASAAGDAQATSRDAVEGFGRWLFAETNGHPFYIMETLKALTERGALAVQRRDDGSAALDFTAAHDMAALRAIIPQGVREVIRARLSRLNPPVQALLAAGAVLGHGFTFERVCCVAGLSDDDGLVALEQALANRLLRETVDVTRGGTYAFVHDKIRDVVYADASEARRRVFHRRAFDALEATDAAAAVLAHHAHAAGLVEPAAAYSLKAGDEAMRLFAVRNAIAHYERALDLATGQARERIAPADLRHLYVQLGRAYELISTYGPARATYTAMLAFAREAGMPAMAAAALSRLAILAAQDLDPLEVGTALELLHEALHLAEQDDDKAVLAETEWSLAHVTFHAWQPRAALVHAERALALARELEHQDLIARSLNVLAVLTMLLGQWPTSAAYAKEALSLYAALGNRAMEADSLSHLSIVQLYWGRPHAALDAAHRMRTISVEIENPWGRATSAFNLAAAWRDAGAYAKALEAAQEAVSLARSYGFPLLLGIGLIVLGSVHRAFMALDAARAAHHEALRIAERMVPRFREQAAAELCADCALAGDWAEAYGYAREALAARDYTFIPGAGVTRPYETAALLWGSKVEEARADLRRFAEQTGAGGRCRVSYLRALAVLARWQGDAEGEIEHLRAAAALAQTVGLPGEEWLIGAALGEAHRAHNEPDAAGRAFAVSAGIIRRLADGLTDSALRGAFLAAPQVRAVLEHAEGR